MGVKVIDSRSQQELEVSPAEAQDGLEAGHFVIAQPEVRVIQGDRTSTVSTEEFSRAAAHGWRLASDEEVAAAKIRREESTLGAQIQGGFEAAARGASFGATDWLAREGGADMERMALRREHLGGLGTTLELAGSLVVPVPGAGAAARGLTKAVASAPKLVRTAVPVAGKGMVEGFAAGAGAEVSEAALGDRDIAASRLLHGGALGALVGGSVAPLVPGLAATGAGLLGVGVRPVRSVLGRASGEAGEKGSTFISSLIGSDESTRAARSRVWASMADVEPDVAARLAGDLVERPSKLADALESAPRVEEEIAAGMRTPTEALRAARDRVRVAFGGHQKQRQVESLLPKEADELLMAQESALRTLDDIDASIGAAHPMANPHDLAEIKRMTAAARQEISRVAATAEGRSSQRHVAAVAFREVDRVKQGVFSLKSDWDRIARSPAPSRESQVMSDVIGGRNGLYNTLRSHLEDESVWGAAATAQKELNQASAQALDARRSLKGSAGARLLDTRTPVVDSADLLTVTRQFGRFRGATKTELFEDALAAEGRYIDAAAKHLELSDAAKEAIAEYKSAASGFRRAIDDKRELVRMLDDIEHTRSREGGRSVSIGITSNLATMAGGAVGAVVGGPLGAAAGAMAAAAFRPYTLIRRLAAIQARLSKAGTMQSSAVDGFIRRVSEGAARGTEKERSIAGSMLQKASSIYAAKSSADSKRIKETVSALATNPTLLSERISRLTRGLDDVAPRLATAVGDHFRRSVMYIASKIPQSYMQQWSSSAPLVDPIDESAFQRRVEGAFSPMSALAHLSRGTFTMEHAEALRVCHPSLFAEEQKRLMEALGRAQAAGMRIPLEDAAQISIFFDVPADPTLASSEGIARAMTPMSSQQRENARPQVGRKSAQIDTERFTTSSRKIGTVS